jgi:predicted aconitase with swiveling domain
MSGRTFRARMAMGPALEGVAMVAKDGFSARYDLDRLEGIFSRPTHALSGRSYVGRILVLETAKGGVATAWMLHEMAARGMAPAALVLNSVNPIMAQGAALAGIPLLVGFDVDITAAIPDGARVRLDPAAGRLTVGNGQAASA